MLLPNWHVLSVFFDTNFSCHIFCRDRIGWMVSLYTSLWSLANRNCGIVPFSNPSKEKFISYAVIYLHDSIALGMWNYLIVVANIFKVVKLTFSFFCNQEKKFSLSTTLCFTFPCVGCWTLAVMIYFRHSVNVLEHFAAFLFKSFVVFHAEKLCCMPSSLNSEPSQTVLIWEFQTVYELIKRYSGTGSQIYGFHDVLEIFFLV